MSQQGKLQRQDSPGSIIEWQSTIMIVVCSSNGNSSNGSNSSVNHSVS